MGYAKVVIVVDETVDPYNLPQVMWALSTKFNPQFDLVVVPACHAFVRSWVGPGGMTYKMVIDATTPKAPETTVIIARSFAIRLEHNSG